MHLLLQQVLEFHQKMQQSIGDPRKPDLSITTKLRWDLIDEEFQELTLALKGRDKHGNEITGQEQVIAVTDALADMAYVIAGAAVTWGIDLGGACDEVHRSNMTKSGGKRVDGKILKGLDYSPPDLKTVLDSAAEDLANQGFGEYSWWPVPTVDSGLPKNEKPNPAPTSPEAYPLNGRFLARGAFLFDCPCGIQHEISLKNGSRGGRATEGECDCLCGKHFSFQFGVDGDLDTVEANIS
jgi:predicted HAD superfamily Cof-like phosphohydrolase